MEKREVFKVEGDKIVRQRKSCPKCGEGVFLADHKDRASCGKCGYTEFKVKKQEEEKPKA
ncbi:MAG: 30S ribosomal protein S27ae [Candidatus Thermoplasmatota archaeon]|jgi:ubiquitin-small subunit ribosomal protein S27Ae